MQQQSGGGTVVAGPVATGYHDNHVSMHDNHHVTMAAQVITTVSNNITDSLGVSNELALQDAEVAIESDKRAIYRHPLFPLMALLFEKCEQATQTPDVPSSDSFDMDIQAFVHHQEQDHKPFFSDDPDLDNVMMKSIQVLRIHLLELEKVTDLCKDFCARYISCLKGKLQSENLLRTDGMPGFDGDDPPSLGSLGGELSPMSGNLMLHSSPAPNATVNQNNSPQIVSGGTVYQMVQTAQGVVATPIQQLPGNPASPSADHTSSAQLTALIHGSTPLSQIGVHPATSPSSHSGGPLNPLMINQAMFDEEFDKKNKNAKRGVLPKQATQVMKSWLFQHIVHPYPTEDEKRQISQQTNLTLLQVNNWFINARRRILQPMLDASTPSENKQKKPRTTNQQRPSQRFWPENIANMQPGGGNVADMLENMSDSPNPDSEDDSQTGLEQVTQAEAAMMNQMMAMQSANQEHAMSLAPNHEAASLDLSTNGESNRLGLVLNSDNPINLRLQNSGDQNTRLHITHDEDSQMSERSEHSDNTRIDT